MSPEKRFRNRIERLAREIYHLDYTVNICADDPLEAELVPHDGECITSVVMSYVQHYFDKGWFTYYIECYPSFRLVMTCADLH